MPTGLKDTQQADAGFGRRTEVGPRRAICDAYQIVFAATLAALNFPPVIVPMGCSVSLRGVNGSVANTDVAFAGRYPVAVIAGRRVTITSDTEQNYPAGNLSEIWAAGTLGDGLVATIRGNAIG